MELWLLPCGERDSVSWNSGEVSHLCHHLTCLSILIHLLMSPSADAALGGVIKIQAKPNRCSEVRAGDQVGTSWKNKSPEERGRIFLLLGCSDLLLPHVTKLLGWGQLIPTMQRALKDALRQTCLGLTCECAYRWPCSQRQLLSELKPSGFLMHVWITTRCY